MAFVLALLAPYLFFIWCLEKVMPRNCCIFCISPIFIRLKLDITKTRLFKYIENFTVKTENFLI